MKTTTIATCCSAVLALLLIAACAPEVGSDKWCEAMKEKSSGDWTVNEAADFARFCILPD